MTAPTYSDIKAFTETVSSLGEMAKADFLNLAKQVDFSDWSQAARELRAIIEPLVNEYGLAASELGAQWYEYCRSLNFTGSYTAKVADVNRSHLVHDANAEIDKLFDGKVSQNRLVNLLSKVVTSTVFAQSRETVIDNLEADRSSSYSRGDREFAKKCRYTVVTSPGACAFCTLLASRGSVYKSDKTEFHANCKCVAVPFADAKEIKGYGKVLESHVAKYESAERMRTSGDMPDDLRKQIADAKRNHEGKWHTVNETVIIMRYQNGMN